MMNVLYDVTNLGLAFGTELTRTGIFRATEHFVRAVIRRPGVEARFAALQSYAGEIQLARFDRSAGALLADRMIAAWACTDASRAASIELVDRLFAADGASSEARRLSAELRLVNRIARERRIDHAFDVYHSLRPALVTSRRVNARARVVTIHDMIPVLFPELTESQFISQHRAVVDSIDKQRDWVVCNSECTRTDFCDLTGMSPDRVFVTPFAAAPGIFRPERDAARIAAVLDRHGIAGRQFLLSLCTLEPRKNLPRLVRAFFDLVEEERWPDLRLVLVGPAGWKNDPLVATLDERPALRERVIIPGFVPDGDLSALYSGAAAFVFPSLYEGFGLPALEAMQCGVPVIASRTGALPEVVGGAALTVDPFDEGALRDAMRVILSDTARAVELARLGLARSKQFTWDRTVDATVQAYGTMLAGS